MYRVQLAHAPNPDLADLGGYWTFAEARKHPAELWVSVATFEEASTRCRDFIDSNDLGSGNWTGGDVRDETGNVVARVSYNGRVWLGPNFHEIYTPQSRQS